MEQERKRIFLVIDEDETDGIHNPDGIYFTKFLSGAEEIWISEKMKGKEEPYVLAGRSMKIPVLPCRVRNGVPTISPKRQRTMEKAYEL